MEQLRTGNGSCVECPSFDMLPGSALVMQPQEKGQWGILAAVLGVKAFDLVFDLCLLIFVRLSTSY